MDASAGMRFGNYQLLKRLGYGGMAEVFLARQRGPQGFDRRVAIKRILPHLADSEDFLRMFFEEARLVASLSHPNIVHIYELGKVEDHYFLAMEYIDGVHAGALIERGTRDRMPVALVARIGADACAGLNYVHNAVDAQGRLLHLVHRDISPPNLMISYDGVVKLMDFGIAKAAGQVDQTRPGVVKGKFAYMSPEQTMGMPLDGRSDVFSLSLILWELLAGRVALPRTDPVEAMTMIRDGKVPSVRAVRSDVPLDLAVVLDQGLQVDREHRPTAAELGHALEGFIKSSPELGTSMELSAWVRRGFPRAATASDRATADALDAVRWAESIPDTSPTQPPLQREEVEAEQDEDTPDTDQTEAPSGLAAVVLAADQAAMAMMARPASAPPISESGPQAAPQLAPQLADDDEEEPPTEVTLPPDMPLLAALQAQKAQNAQNAQNADSADEATDPAVSAAWSDFPRVSDTVASRFVRTNPTARNWRRIGLVAAAAVLLVVLAVGALLVVTTGARGTDGGMDESRPGSTSSGQQAPQAPQAPGAAGATAPALAAPGTSSTMEPDTAAGAPRTGRLIVITEPPGAEVSVGNTPPQTAPARFIGLAPGSHTVTVRMPGHATEHREVEIHAGDTQDLVVRLAPVQAAPAAKATDGGA